MISDRVLEVDGAALGVGQPAVVEDLQQDVEDVGVRLLDLVEQEHGVGPPAHRLGQLTRLLVADVTGRGADQPADRVPLLELGHVEADHRVLVTEQRLGERARELGLPDSGGPEEEEAADRAIRVAEAGAGAAHSLGDRRHGLVLADNPLVQLLLEAQQPLALFGCQLRDRDPRGPRDDLGDVLGRHLGRALALATGLFDPCRRSSIRSFSSFARS